MARRQLWTTGLAALRLLLQPIVEGRFPILPRRSAIARGLAAGGTMRSEGAAAETCAYPFRLSQISSARVRSRSTTMSQCSAFSTPAMVVGVTDRLWSIKAADEISDQDLLRMASGKDD